MANPRLSPEQQAIVDAAVTGQNVIYTGPGGVGKSTVARAIKVALTQSNIRFEVCAPTGCAAEQIQAKTIHSLFFKDLGNKPVEYYVKMWTKTKWARRKWTYLQTILVDEIGMVGQKLWEKMDAVLRGIMKTPLEPFGGKQIIACGDFYQLPPIQDSYCFNSAVFRQVFPVIHVLHKVYRQSGDIQFLRALHNLRTGPMNQETYELIHSRLDKLPPPDVPAIRIFPKNYDVNRYNFYKLQALTGPSRTYKCKWTPSPIDPDWVNEKQYKGMTKNGPFEASLTLKQGSFVRYTRNAPALGLVNGSMGIIVGFTEESDGNYPIVKFVKGITRTITPIPVKSNNERCVMTQVPLKLAWAASVHRLQGAQVDSAVIDLGENTFAFGQGYTAISRVTSLAGLYVSALDRDSILPDPDVIQFMSTYPKAQ